jgi:hypothetical protein
MRRKIAIYVRQHHLALLCLFLIAGTGTAWAIERDSVKSKHIVDDQVRAADIDNVDVLEATGALDVDDSDSEPGPTTDTLVSTAEFELIGSCEESPAGTLAALLTVETKDSAAFVLDSDATADQGEDDEFENPGASGRLIGVGPTSGRHYETGVFSLRTAGETLHGFATASTFPDEFAECSFELTVIG